MKVIGNLLALVGILLFAYTIVAKVMGFEKLPGFVGGTDVLGLSFTPLGALAGTICVMLIAIVLILNQKQ